MTDELPSELQRDELPVCAVHSTSEAFPDLPFAILDVQGRVRKRFATMEEAQKVVGELNVQATELMQPDIHDTGTDPVQEEQEKPPAEAEPKTKPETKTKSKAKAKSKGKSMPRGIPNKKRASKKSAAKKSTVKPTKKAAVTKKAAKKTMKRRKKRTAY
jgi:hypothetical protein